MRFDGTLKSWNAERGFGCFITPVQGGQELFVHITAFARNAQQPAVGEKLSFEVEKGPDGKKRAVRVLRPGETVRQAASYRSSSRRTPASGAGGLFGGLVTLAIVAALGWYAYGHYQSRMAAHSAPAGSAPAGVPAPSMETNFRCDGRQHCSQMTSCSEAKFFLKNCPGVKMDGNNDGVPCEQQWCTSPFAK